MPRQRGRNSRTGCCNPFCVVISIGAAVLLFSPLYEDTLKSTGYWGTKHITNDAPEDNPVIHKFKVHVPNDVLADLKRRLLLSRYTHLLYESWPSSEPVLKDILDYWTNQYDWRVHENQLNQFSHFKTEVEGIQVHFLHSKPRVTDPKTKVYTLLMLHDWPGSPVEFLRVLPLLTQPESGVAFEVICPSNPGYGFSEVPHKEGFNSGDAARIFVKLMDRIQRNQFFVHGGGWGAKIAKYIALYHPQRVLGVHFSSVILQPDIYRTLIRAVKSLIASFLFSDGASPSSLSHPLEERRYLGETGYQPYPTAPDIVGVALLNSPSALAAYLLEKFPAQILAHTVGARNAAPDALDFLDDFLTNTMLYWVSNSITTSVKYYKENMGKVLFEKLSSSKMSVPTGFSLFLDEHASVLRYDVQSEYKNLTTFVEHPNGGPFAAMHQSEILAKDIRDFVIAVEETANNDPYAGPPVDFPFTITDPQAPVVKQVEQLPRERPTQPQRFEPKPATEPKAREQKGEEVHAVPNQAPKDNATPKRKSAEAPSRTPSPPTPSTTPRPALQQTKGTVKPETQPKVEQPRQPPKVPQATKETKPASAKSDNVLREQTTENAAQEEKKVVINSGSPKTSNIPKGSAKQEKQEDRKGAIKGEGVLRGTATLVNDGDEDLTKRTKENQAKKPPSLKTA